MSTTAPTGVSRRPHRRARRHAHRPPSRRHRLVVSAALVTAVAVLAGPAATPAAADMPFTDVPEGTYYHRPVEFLFEAGVTTGCAPDRYCPHDAVSRADFVTLLWRIAQQPVVEAPHGFVDVPEGTYYTQAVAWMKAEGYVEGCAADRFCPLEPLSRAQLATLLWRFDGAKWRPGRTGFIDVPPRAYYSRAVRYMVERGVTTGCAPYRFCPHEPATRAQVATILWRIAGRP